MTEDELVEDVFERFCDWSLSLGDRKPSRLGVPWYLETEATEVDRHERRTHWICRCAVCKEVVVRVQWIDKYSEQRAGIATTKLATRILWKTIYREQADLADFHVRNCLLEWWSKTDATLPGPGREGHDEA